MKKTVLKTTNFCDNCLIEENYIDSCLNCGSQHCWECKKKLGIIYTHGVYISGSGDGYYCKLCDNDKNVQKNELHKAYIIIKQLKDESEQFWKDFKNRSNKAEQTLKTLLQKYNIKS